MNSESTEPDFFQSLKSFSNFSEFTDASHFRPVPPDWCVVITDVKDSTEAIESGHYKDVNTIGAASIAVVQNALGGREIPFAFGGDGATLLIPASCRNLVTEKLAALKHLARKNFGLELRVGLVPVAEILDSGRTIEVARYELFSGKCVAIFRGGGLTHAERRVKDAPEDYDIPESDSTEADLGGLSCRWNAIPNQHGCVLSMLVVAHGSDEKRIYTDLFEKLESIFSFGENHPVHPALMGYRSAAECARDERRYHRGRSIGWFKRNLEIIAAVLIFKWKIPPLFFRPKRYAESMRTHSDYRKFDDMLRMVIDCALAQAEALKDYLEQARCRGELSYGLHRSENSLMTCYVHGIDEGNHIHFIDGGNGGYAIAAKQLKEQLKSDH